MSIKMFLELLLDPAAIIRRLPDDVQIALSKRGTLSKWADDGSAGEHLRLHNYPANRKRGRGKAKTDKPKALLAMEQIAQECGANLNLKTLVAKTGYSPSYVTDCMRKLGYTPTLSSIPEKKFFTKSPLEKRGDKYSEIYKFYQEHLPRMKLPIIRADLLPYTRQHKIVGTNPHHRSVCSKVIRNMEKEGRLVISTDKKLIVSVSFNGVSHG